MAITALVASDDDVNSTFVIKIDDISPTIVYSPFADTFASPSLAAGWNPFFSISGFANDSSAGAQGEGSTFHVTSADGASLGLRWNGTGATLFGFFDTTVAGFPSSMSYSVSLDGVPTTNYASHFTTDADSADNVLAAFSGLELAEHSVQLTLHNSGNISDDLILLRFDRANLTSQLPASTKQTTSQGVTSVTYPDESISFHGQWSFNAQILPNESVALHTSTNVGDSASLIFNGTAVILSGLTTPLSGSYNISLDNAPPTTFSARSSFNASSPTALFYATGLDPAVVHRLEVVNIGTSSDDQGSLLILGSVNVTTTRAQDGSGTTPVASMTSGLQRGTIAAISIGVAIAAFAFVVFAVIYYRRRRQEFRRKQSFIVNPDVHRRRFSFLTRQHPPPDNEKARQASDHDDGSHDSDVLDITTAKVDGDDEETDDEDIDLRGLGDNQECRTHHGSQNSDGSYAIDLPELPKPGTGHVRVRSNGDSPSPTRRYSDLQAPGKITVTPASPTPSSPLRSPKPRGPRDRRTIIAAHERESSRGILLKEMYSPVADVPVDVQTNDSLLMAAFLPQPNISPLRVNFEDEMSNEAEQRREARRRSESSGVSLSYSLKQALMGHIRFSHDRHPSPANSTPSGGSPRRISFLDLDSSSASVSSRSNRRSRSASTHSSLRPREREGSEHSVPTPPLPQPPRVSMGFSMTMAGGPTSSRPSMSPDISLKAVSLSPITIPDHPLLPHDVPTGIHPMSTSELPSPTDSIPLTVSDIHFRHSTHSSTSHLPESRRTSHRISNPQRSPHPPLPSPSAVAPQTEERPYIVQRILGIQTSSGPNTPYGSPTVSGFASRWSRGRGSVAGPSNYSRPRTGPPG